MTSCKNLSPAEKQVRRIGGALASDYYTLREMIASINADYFPLFELMGLDSPEQTDRAIDILLGDTLLISARNGYVKSEIDKIESGKLNIEKFVTERLLSKEYKTPEEKEKAINRELHRVFSIRFRKLEKCFREKYGYMQRRYNKEILRICRGALSLVPGGFIIDAGKFIEIYGNYLEASISQTGKKHLEAAEAINRFFRGKVEITERELKKYFVIEDGILKPNPKSINRENYMRLGYRGKTKVSKA